jgi:YVTN family beta-propeller protein
MFMARVAVSLMLLLLSSGSAGKLSLVATIELPGVEGRFDHFAADVKGQRLFVAALGNDTLEVIDVRGMKRVHTIRGLHKPCGVAFIPESNRIVVAGGGDGTLRFYDGKTYELLGQVKDLDDADNVRYDAVAGVVYCGFGDGAIAFVDAKTMKKIGEVKLAAHPESFQLESKSRRIFVNVPQAPGGPHVAVIDREARKVVATWPLPRGVAANFPMALDEKTHRLFVGCRKPAQLLVFNTETGKPVASVKCPDDTDDVFYDAALAQVYVSGGAGTLNVLARRDADRYDVVQTIRAAEGARTSFFIPEAKTLFVAVPHRGSQPAELRVYQLN